MSRKYPVGVETFSEIIEDGYVYIDKTEIIYKLIQSGKYFFLSRPRRFGKSLMLSTIEAYFEGRRELFDGLWLGRAEGVDWTRRPVVRMNFVDADTTDPKAVEGLIRNHLCKWENLYGLSDNGLPLGQRFHNVIEAAAQATGQRVVVLIDEYDKVLVNSLGNTACHERMRDILKPIFAVLKGADRYIEFAMLTGVSRFSKLSVFSDLNNLRDISLSEGFCTVCGITEEELTAHLGPDIQAFADAKGMDYDTMLHLLKDNYDGYHFSAGCPDIYNPYSLLNAFAEQKLVHKWFESGTPTFLLERIYNSDEDIESLLSPLTSGGLLANMSISDTDLTNMLYQTGYLTITDYDAEDDVYTLGIPNREVEEGLFRSLLPLYTGKDPSVNEMTLIKLRRALRANEIDRFMAILQSFLASVPYSLSEGRPEMYYENNIFLIFKMLGFDAQIEIQTAQGRIDIGLKTQTHIYIIELKLDASAAMALKQITDRNYALPFKLDGRQLVLIGVNISRQTRTIDSWEIELLKP